MIPAVAAGHTATADAGAELLRAGGTAADAAVGACLASCVAETLMTGLLGGGHAIYHDAGAGTTTNLDSFVAVPTGAGAPMEQVEVRFGEETVRYAVGASSCAVPGVTAGLDALWRRHGRLPWRDVVAPALRLAQEDAVFSPAHAACLRMLAPVMTMREGARIYAPRGALLEPGERVAQPGLATALELLRDEGPRSVYEGTIARSLLALSDERGGSLTGPDLAGYDAVWCEPLEVAFADCRVLTRGGIGGVPEALAALEPPYGRDQLLDVLDRPGPGGGQTTNISVVDAEGNACVLTTSLGLGSGDWLPGLDVHLNSMLGEVDLIREPLVPGARMASMMAPSLVFDEGGLSLAIGSAGGTRLRTALVGVLAAVLGEGVPLQQAIDRPRFHPVADVVNAEPGVDEGWLASLEARGRAVRRWPAFHHFFGGVSAVGRDEAGADPRRSGAVRRP
ncbi:MAG TPA: gamma-glutamyltransferase [Gaiellaceae bacterium]